MKDTDNAPLQIQREQDVDQRLQVMFFCVVVTRFTRISPSRPLSEGADGADSLYAAFSYNS